MKILRLFDSLKFVRAIFVAVACVFILNVAHADNPNCANYIDYTSATGTVTQNGTPTPTNPIEPQFYTQGKMVLRAVGDVADSYDAETGKITRRVGVKVLDGTEEWTEVTTSTGVYRYRFKPTEAPKLEGSRGHCISTHFFDIGGVTVQDVGGVFSSTVYLYFIPNQDVDTVAKWTAFLASQYNAGTPVIVVYPLATSTTETVTGQTLTITQGTNIVSAEGSVDDLELEISYKGYAELTVQEIEAVNTDENVEVTIG